VRIWIVIGIIFSVLEFPFDIYEVISCGLNEGTNEVVQGFAHPLRTIVLLFFFERLIALKVIKKINIDGDYKMIPD
jgi:hypothetical protein